MLRACARRNATQNIFRQSPPALEVTQRPVAERTTQELFNAAPQRACNFSSSSRCRNVLLGEGSASIARNLRLSSASLAEIQAGSVVTLAGWLSHIRIVSRHVAFAVLLLPRGQGEIQLVIRSHSDDRDTVVSNIEKAGLHGVVLVRGRLAARPASQQKDKDPLSHLEVEVEACKVLNSVAADALPFLPREIENAAETKRMRNRHLDLRVGSIGANLRLRSRLTQAVRQYLYDHDFDEIETPTLLRSSPEGAREYLVPTRLSAPGEDNHHRPQFYALQQSPQQAKQILMVSGVTDKYFQIAKCFRDEGARKDRQPEFTQIDLEMSFVSGEVSEQSEWPLGAIEIRDTIEGLIRQIWNAAGRGADIASMDATSHFPVIAYDEAMNRFGSDKPDLRLSLELLSLGNSLIGQAGDVDEIERDVLQMEVEVMCFTPPSRLSFSKRDVQKIIEDNAELLQGVESFHVDMGNRNEVSKLLLRKSYNVRSFIRHASFEAESVDVEAFKKRLAEAQRVGRLSSKESCSSNEKSWIFLAQRSKQQQGGSTKLGELRRLLLQNLLHRESDLAMSKCEFAWIVNFPLFTRADEDKHFMARGRWSSSHHPFTSPTESDIEKLQDEIVASKTGKRAVSDDLLGSLKGQHYDLVLNGVEIGGGSVRIHNAALQKAILQDVLQLTPSELGRFDHLLRALSHGAPPHAGIALGLDRIMTILCETNTIRDVIAFPKSMQGRDLLFNCPDALDTHASDSNNSSATEEAENNLLRQYKLQRARPS